MDFEKYRHLKKLIRHVGSFSTFINEVAKWPRRYGVPLWTRSNYQWFFDKIQGGHNYQTIFQGEK